MKTRKSLLALIMAVAIILMPQVFAFAGENEGAMSTNLSPHLIANSYKVDGDVYAGDSFKLAVELKNTSKNIDVQNVLIRVNGGEVFNDYNGTDTVYTDKIAKNATYSFTKNMICASTTDGGSYPINVSATYEYFDDGEKFAGTSEFTISVNVNKNAQKTTTQSASLTPQVLISDFSYGGKRVSGGSNFTLNFNVKNNSSSITVKNVLIKLSGGEAFVAADGTDTVSISSLSANETTKVSKKFQCLNSTISGVYPITASISFEYFDNGEKQQGNEELTMSVKVNKSEQKTTTKSASLTPQILIFDFSYGGGRVSGGNNFTLNFNVKNNSSSITVKNVLIKLSGGEAFVVADGTDTVSISSLSANGTKKVSKEFQCLNSARSGVYPITASISFEYFDNGEKQQGNEELTMSVPVVQPDIVAFEGIADINVTVDQETDCSFQIINSGQTKLSNGRVVLKDKTGTELASAYIGTIEAGMQFSSNYTLPVTFNKVGDKTLTLVFEYSDENMQQKSIEQTFNVKVEEYNDPYEEIDNNDSQENTKATSPIIPIVCGVAGVVALIIIAIVASKVVKKKKLQKGSEVIDEEI